MVCPVNFLLFLHLQVHASVSVFFFAFIVARGYDCRLYEKVVLDK